MPAPDEAPPKPRAPRPSAAVMVTRGPASDPEVLLAERNPKLRFFGGSWAFPGGTLDAMDVELAELLAGREAAGPDGATDEGDPLVHSREVEDLALACCALRELFEETGVLLEPLRTALPPGDADATRRRAELRTELSPRAGASDAGRDAWLELCRPFAARGDLLDALTPIGRITTPGFRPLRYETLFLRAELPGGEAPEVVDIWPGELVAGRFAKPAEALAAWRRGEERVVPPVLFQLEFMARALAAGDLDRAWPEIADAMAAIVAGRLHSAYTTPGILAAPLRTPTLPPAATTNAYLVGESEVYVVDPGAYEPSEQERLFETLDRWTSAGRRVRGVVLTHRHADHIGAVSAVCARYDVPLFAHPITLEDLAPLWGAAGVEASLSAGGGHRDLGTAPAAQVPVDEGHAFELGDAPDGSSGWQLVVHHTPGHARGHVALRDSRYGAMVVGDMLSTLSTIVIDPPEGHLATYLASLERLIELGGDGQWVLLPAHGPWTHRGRAACERYLAHRAEREASLVRALDAGLSDLKELVAHVYADTDERAWPVAERSLEAGLEKLREEGRL